MSKAGRLFGPGPVSELLTSQQIAEQVSGLGRTLSTASTGTDRR